MLFVQLCTLAKGHRHGHLQLSTVVRRKEREGAPDKRVLAASGIKSRKRSVCGTGRAGWGQQGREGRGNTGHVFSEGGKARGKDTRRRKNVHHELRRGQHSPQRARGLPAAAGGPGARSAQEQMTSDQLANGLGAGSVVPSQRTVSALGGGKT